MALADIFAAVSALIPQQGSPLAAVPSFMGPENLQQEAVPPRIVWVPSNDKFGPTERLGDANRQVRTRIAGVDIHVWGIDYASTELLVNQVVAAIHACAASSYELTDGAWMAAKAGPSTDLGRVYAFNVRFKIPLTMAPPTVKTITTIPVTTEPLDAPQGDAVIATLTAS